MRITLCLTANKPEPWQAGLQAALPGAQIDIWTPGAPLADQIVRAVAARVDERLLRPGARMPSIRRFAASHGVSPFKADRNHMHHLLLDAGYRPFMVVALIAGGSLALGIAAALAVKMGVYRPVLVGCFFMLLGSWYLFTRNRENAVARLRRLRGGKAGPEESLHEARQRQ